jgi:FkbM family methyltransferase
MLGRMLLNKLFSILINALNKLVHAEAINIVNITKKIYYFTLFFSGKVGKFLAYCKTPLGHLFIPYEDGSFYYIKEILVEEIYDRLWRNETFDLIIDIGAHVGIFTLKVAKRGRMILAFEPHPVNYLIFSKNVKYNMLNNVIPLRLALSDGPGVTYLYEGRFSGSASIKPLLGRHATSIKVQVDTLDNVVSKLYPNLNITEISVFIKLDAEVSEVEILRGSSKLLTTAKRIKISCASYHYPDEVIQVYNFLKKMGFKILVSKNNIVYAEKY